MLKGKRFVIVAQRHAQVALGSKRFVTEIKLWLITVN